MASILETMDMIKGDLDAIRLVAGDGYSIEVPNEILVSRDIILAYEIDSELLPDEAKPIRAFIPEERAMYWVSNLERVELLASEEQADIKELRFLETEYSLVEQEDYQGDKAVKVGELLQDVEGPNNVYFSATDGFEKNEQLKIFKDGYLKITGEETPMFTAPDLPVGMQVKDILYFSVGETAFLSVESALEVLDLKYVEEIEGLPLTELVQLVGLVDTEAYYLIADDGYQVEIFREDLNRGIVYYQDGEVVSFFEGLPKNTQVKNLSSIIPVK